jgi:hypothetical protein
VSAPVDEARRAEGRRPTDKEDETGDGREGVSAPVDEARRAEEDRIEKAKASVQRDLDTIVRRLKVRGMTPPVLLGVGPGRLESDGPALLEFLGGLKERLPALNPFVVVVGLKAKQYEGHRAVLLAANGLEEASAALTLLGAGRLECWGTSEEVEAWSRALQRWGSPITVTGLSGDLPSCLSRLLKILGGLEEGLSLSEVETITGVRLHELADHFKELAGLGA